MQKDAIAGKEEADEPAEVSQQPISLVAEFGRVFNGPWWTRGGSLIHYCSGEGCCPGGESCTRQRMVSCLLKLILKKKPVVPTANKWTKHSACHLFFWFGNAAHGCLHLLFNMGCGKMRLCSGTPSRATSPGA